MRTGQPTGLARVRGMARSVNVYLKVAAGCVGIAAAVLWYWSAVEPIPAASAAYNARAALATGVSVLCQAVAAGIDARIAPTATWG
jgi:hypothetical protein